MPETRPVKVTVVLEFTGNSAASYSSLTARALALVDPALKRDITAELREGRIRSVNVEDTGI